MSLTKQEALQKLNEIVSRITQLEGQRRFSEGFQKWQHDVRALLKHVFPNDRAYIKEFHDIRFSPGIMFPGQSDTDFQDAYVSGLRSSRAMLESRIDEITQFWEEPETSAQPGFDALNRLVREYGGTPRSSPEHPELVFVIHGRQLLADFHSFLLGLKPLEWSQARKLTSKTNPFTWEIVDTALTEAGAIVALFHTGRRSGLRQHLLTEHDSSLERQYMSQPRQNVLFEAGVAYGRAPDRTVLIRVGALRPMSDLAGHHVIQFDDSAESRQAVADALRTAGCPVDTTGSDWYRAGTFSLPERQSRLGDEVADSKESKQARDVAARLLLLKIRVRGSSELTNAARTVSDIHSLFAQYPIYLNPENVTFLEKYAEDFQNKVHFSPTRVPELHELRADIEKLHIDFGATPKG